MAYVINYFIIADGQAHQSQGTNHYDALMCFIAHPGSFLSSGGTYEATEGEQITVVGAEQGAFSDAMHHRSMGQRLMETAARGGQGSQVARQRYRAWEGRPEPVVPNVTKVYTIKARTVFDGVEAVGEPVSNVG